MKNLIRSLLYSMFLLLQVIIITYIYEFFKVDTIIIVLIDIDIIVIYIALLVIWEKIQTFLNKK